MNSYERVFARLAGRPVDRVPNLCILMTFAAKYIGVTYDRYVSDYRLLVDGNLRCCEDFKIDMLSAISDPMREAHGFGANVIFPYDGVPYASEAFIQSRSDLKKLKVKSPESSKRMADRLEAIRLFHKKADGQIPILGWVEGGFAEVCDLHDMSAVMTDLIQEPELINDMLEICTEQAILFAQAQVAAGADFIGIGDAAASLIGPRLYKQFALPYEQRIISAIHEAGAKAKLHICGNITSILDLTIQTGTDILDVDWMVDFSKAVATCGAKCAVCGNFDPVAVLLQSTPEKINSAVQDCLAVSNPNTMIAAGCEVPRDTPMENLQAVALALK
ncbi:uroporphyrinogen decarboxylase family protein [Chloroflexota bacterium]|nr:uroporphyrinogen decarboxylase family protein [Chloroflexota bacterium]